MIVALAASVGAASAAGSSDDQQTAEQKYKNIQALKGLPESQLIEVMSYMEASLGAKDCAYCHVKSAENNWAWEKDDIPKKQTARKMVQMVLDINRASFNGRPEVTCYTCHQGHEHPVAIPSLPLPTAEAEAQMPRPAGKWPTPNETLDKYTEAVGGKDAAAKFGALVLKGKQTGQDGSGVPVEVYWKASGKFLLSIATPGGTFAQGYDGSAGWMQNRNDTHEMNAAELARVKAMESLYDPLKIREPYPRMRLAGKEKIGEREAWVFRAQGQDNSFERLYFDSETGLLLRKVTLTSTMVGTIPAQFDFEDYREIEGVRLPFTIRFTGLNSRRSWDQKFETVQRDLAIEDSKFSKPATSENRPQVPK